MVPYTVDAEKDKNGAVIALTWQATLGGFFYRRSIAKKYLGTDEPEKIQNMMTTMDDFMKMGEKVRDKSNGGVYLLASKQELMRIALANRKNPWVKKIKLLLIDPAMEEFVDMSKEITCIDFSTTTQYDDNLNDIWMNILNDYLDGKISRDMIETEFIKQAKVKYPYLEA